MSLPKLNLNEEIKLPTTTSSTITRFKSLLIRSKPITSTSEVEEKVTRELERLSKYLPGEMCLEANSRMGGLFDDEALQRILVEKKGMSEIEKSARLLFNCFANPFNLLLSVLAIISIATGDFSTFSVMLVMIVVSTGLRFWQESKSLKKAADLVLSITHKVGPF